MHLSRVAIHHDVRGLNSLPELTNLRTNLPNITKTPLINWVGVMVVGVEVMVVDTGAMAMAAGVVEEIMTLRTVTPRMTGAMPREMVGTRGTFGNPHSPLRTTSMT